MSAPPLIIWLDAKEPMTAKDWSHLDTVMRNVWGNQCAELFARLRSLLTNARSLQVSDA